MLATTGSGWTAPLGRVGTWGRSMPIELPPWHHGAIPMQSPDLTAVMADVQRGDERAFAVLYDALAGVVYGSIARVLRDPAMSEEVAQEVFVELWRTATRFDASRSSVSTWAVTIARRRAIDRVRREQSQRDRVERAGTLRADEAPATDDVVLGAVEAREVEAALAELPDDQRVVIEMAFLDGESHGTIAERLDLPLGTVKSRVRGGLKKLGRRWEVTHGSGTTG
jgi:RNA polymerase sigma-70 factor (ECF subfamily)